MGPFFSTTQLDVAHFQDRKLHVGTRNIRLGLCYVHFFDDLILDYFYICIFFKETSIELGFHATAQRALGFTCLCLYLYPHPPLLSPFPVDPTTPISTIH